jgi:hypothetical protein
MDCLRRGTARRAPVFFVFFFLALLPLPSPAEAAVDRESESGLTVEYGLDSLERRYYHPIFRFDFPFRWGSVFSEIHYHARMNGGLQGAIDYWVNVGLQKRVHENLTLEARLNHFCRHETVRDTPYIWNMNEVLACAEAGDEKFTLGLGLGGFIGGSDGYRGLAVMSGSWAGFIIPELSLALELKLVNFSRIYHECEVALALNRNLELFLRNARHYEFPNMSYFGLRYKSGPGGGAFLDVMKMQVGALPFDDSFKTEVCGSFRFGFFANSSRRVVAAVDFDTPILKGDAFLAQFWPGKMVYDIALEYERKIGSGLFVSWATHYRLDMPVDEGQPFQASLFSGLALRNLPDLDTLEKNARFEIGAGYDFKRGLEASGRLGVTFLSRGPLKLFFDLRARANSDRMRLDLRVAANLGRAVQFRPFFGWREEFVSDPAADNPGRLLIGLEFFKKF